MIILNPRLKQRGKRYASTDFYLSQTYLYQSRIVFMIDGNLRMIIRKSLTKIKVSFPDSTAVYFNQSSIHNFIK